MENSKRSKTLDDRLSELPDSLIFNIFEFLQMNDVVRTTILSHRWKDLWTESPNLNFDISRGKYGIDKFRSFVNRALSLWRGTRLLKFKLSYRENVKNSLLPDVDTWLRFVIDHGVEELHISKSKGSRVSQCVYSCSSLRKLCLTSSCLKINGNVEWNQLKSLTIVECDGVNQRVIEQILRGSPLLEVLALSLARNVNLSFRSTSLKELSICRDVDCLRSKPTELRIWTPNLETLAISGYAFSKYLLENVSSLTHVTLGFLGQIGKDFVGFPFGDLLPSFQHVERVTLLGCCIKVIGKMGTKRIFSLPNVNFLKLTGRSDEFKNVVRLLENFPNIKTLVLQDNGRDYLSNAKSNREFKPDDPSEPLVRELRTIEITWTKHDFSLIFPLIEIMLKHASKLEKMVFRVKGFKPPSPQSNSLFLASQKLLKMQKSYPNAELVFCEYYFQHDYW